MVVDCHTALKHQLLSSHLIPTAKPPVVEDTVLVAQSTSEPLLDEEFEPVVKVVQAKEEPLPEIANNVGMLLETHAQVFHVTQLPSPDLTMVPPFTIKLRERAVLPCGPPRRLSPALVELVRDEISSLSELGIIRPSTSPVCSPVVMVLYPDRRRRMCVPPPPLPQRAPYICWLHISH